MTTNPSVWLEVYKVFGVGGIISLLLAVAVGVLFKRSKKNDKKIEELNKQIVGVHESYFEKFEKRATDYQDNIDNLNRLHEDRMDEMSKAYTQSIEKVGSKAHEDHVRMEMLIQSQGVH